MGKHLMMNPIFFLVQFFLLTTHLVVSKNKSSFGKYLKIFYFLLTIFIKKFPILSAHFTKVTGDEIIMGSRHKTFYVYDMHSGKMLNVNPYAGKALNDEYAERSISTNFEISADNRLIAFVGSQGQIHLFSCKVKKIK